MSEEAKPLSLTLNVARKVQTKSYESADIGIYLSGITAETTPEEIDDLISVNGALAFEKLVAAVEKKVLSIKNNS